MFVLFVIHVAQTVTTNMELAWHSCSVMDCHTTARGSIPGGNGVKSELYIICKGQLMAVPSLNDLTVEGR